MKTRSFREHNGTYPSVTIFVVSFFFVLLLAKAGDSATITDNFNDNIRDPSLWALHESGGPTAQETNNRLEITIPPSASGDPFYGGYKTVLKFAGDLDVQVDYSLLTWPQPQNGVRMGIMLYDVLGSFAAVERVSLEGVGEVYVTHFGNDLTQIPTTDSIGRLRLQRVGNQLSGYYWDGMDWALIAGGTYQGADVPTSVVIAAWSHDWCFLDQEVKVAFDNFSVSGPNVVPLPPAFFLLGSGLLAAGLIRRKRR